MESEKIIKRIENIREELSQDQFEIMCNKIKQKEFHFHRSNRNSIKKKFIEKLRKRLILELELILDPILENQREINKRFLDEIDKLKKDLLSLQAKPSHKKLETKD